MEALSNKNTYYVPPQDDVSNFDQTGPLFNNMMGEGLEGSGHVSFPKHNDTTGLNVPKPLLEQSYHEKMDEIIIATRRIGVSVEGYFQRFGKFSTQDGVRKVDTKQFRDAVANLDGMEWAKEKPFMVD